MIVDLGGGTSEIAVICLGGIVVHATERVGGTHLDEAINSYVRRKYNLLIGERMAEEVKLELGSALPYRTVRSYEVRGRNTIDGLPNTVVITSTDVLEAIRPHLECIDFFAKPPSASCNNQINIMI